MNFFMITVACPGILCYYLGNHKAFTNVAGGGSLPAVPWRGDSINKGKGRMIQADNTAGREYGPAAPCLTTASAKEREK